MLLNVNKNHLKCFLAFLLTFVFTVEIKAQSVQQAGAKEKPNILFILMDDMGYGDLGVLTQNKRKLANNSFLPWFNTPNLDKLSTEGALLTNHYASAPVCAPSRASLLSGLSQGHANVRDNQFDKALADNYTMANVLGNLGYSTAVIGKWGLQGDNRFDKNGDKWPGYPLNRGFDYFYGYVRHKDGHEHYPFEGKYDGKKEVYENRVELSNQLAKCYTGDLFTAKAKNWITEQSTAKKPFFLLLSYDTPHAVTELPTQAYPAGAGLNGGLQFLDQPGRMINTASGEIDSWINPDYINATYDDDHNPETAEIPWPKVYKRYATVLTRIDEQVGDLMALLTDLKISKNTIVVFTSDNGPSVESYLKQPFKANFFDSFGPFSGIKRDLLEGGARVPTIVKWPNQISPNQIINEPSISYDWLPTFTDAAGFAPPVNGNGISLIPSLTQKTKESRIIYSEYFVGGKSPNYPEFPMNNRKKQRNQMQMIRQDSIVGLRYDIKSQNDDFEIYNVVKDPAQANNLSHDPKMVGFQKLFKAEALKRRLADTSAKRPYDDALIPSVTLKNPKKGINWQFFKTNTSWIPSENLLKATSSGKTKNVNSILKKAKENGLYLFKAYINIPVSGNYTFSLTATNKSFVKIHDINLLDGDFGYQPGTEKTQSVNLEKGFHPIKIYYKIADQNSKNDIKFEWESATIPKSIIPQNAFYKN